MVINDILTHLVCSLCSFNGYGYFWIPIIGCHIGGVLGCWIYKLFIELHWPEEDETESEQYYNFAPHSPARAFSVDYDSKNLQNLMSRIQSRGF